MSWGSILVVALVPAVALCLKRLGLVSAKDAQKYLKEGALVVDVRSRGEFRAGHLPDSMNIPLDELQSNLPSCVPDKSKVLMLHCLSGLRSGIGRRALRSMGYLNVFNLGSYRRAERIVGKAQCICGSAKVG